MSDGSVNEVLKIETRELAPKQVIEVWTIDRAQVLNALSLEVLNAIEQAGLALAKECEKKLSSRRALLIRGAGDKAFVAGADIAAMQAMDSTQAEAFAKLAHRAFARLADLPIPTIAAVNGFALGGGMELASACDVIIASERSQFGQPEAHLGLIPGFGGCARFVQRLGMHKALELLYSGQRIAAPEALQLKLIQRCVPNDQDFWPAVDGYISELVLKSSPLALAKIKLVARSATKQIVQDVCKLELETFAKIFESEDKKIGLQAFLEKSKAEFVGR